VIASLMFLVVVLLVIAIRKRWHWAVSLVLVVALAGLVAGTPDGHTVTHSLTVFARAVGDTQ
jgi:H+/gluconate symporter-like permease